MTTRYMTSRVNEMLGTQIAVIQDLSSQLKGDDIDELEHNISALEGATNELRSMLVSLPHHHKE